MNNYESKTSVNTVSIDKSSAPVPKSFGTVNQIGSGHLPADPLKTALKENNGLDIRTVIAKVRARGEISRAALALYKDACKEVMHQQLTYVVQNATLTMSAEKREQYDAYLQHTGVITARLNKNIDLFLDTMQDHEFMMVEDACKTLDERENSYRHKLDSGLISQSTFDRMYELAVSQCERKTEIVKNRVDKFILEMDEQVKLVVSRFNSENDDQLL